MKRGSAFTYFVILAVLLLVSMFAIIVYFGQEDFSNVFTGFASKEGESAKSTGECWAGFVKDSFGNCVKSSVSENSNYEDSFSIEGGSGGSGGGSSSGGSDGQGVLDSCGNAFVDSGEVCDSNSVSCVVSGYSGSKFCNSACSGYGSCQTDEFCGDLNLNGNEQCDDGNTQGGDGCSSSCQIESSGDGDFNTFISASRTYGVAPLGVNFDAIGNLNWAQTEALDFSWDFGDGTENKNGYLSAHVFENSGTYTVKLTVRDISGNTEEFTKTINVENANSFYSGAKTVCFSNDVDFSGCPSGATKVTTNKFSVIDTHVSSSKRLLLKRGDSFDRDVEISLTEIEGLSFGDFGSGNKPVVNADMRIFQVREGVEDLRIFNINFQGSGNGDPFVRVWPLDSGDTVPKNLLINNLEIDSMGYIMNVESGGSIENTIVNNIIASNMEKYGIFSGGNSNVAILDSTIELADVSGAEHGIRLMDGDRLLVNNVDVEISNDQKTDVTFRGDLNYVLLSDSLLRANLGIGSTSGDLPIDINNVIIERNLFDKPNSGMDVSQRISSVNGKNLVIRNNVFYEGKDAMEIKDHQNAGSIETENVRVYNNVIYNSRFIQIFENVENVFVSNNVYYVNSAGAVAEYPFRFRVGFGSSDLSEFEIDNNIYFVGNDAGAGSFTWIEGLGVKDWAAWQALGYDLEGFYDDPQFLNSGSGNFKLKSSSVGQAAGDRITVRDFNLNIRPTSGAHDIGAFES